LVFPSKRIGRKEIEKSKGNNINARIKNIVRSFLARFIELF